MRRAERTKSRQANGNKLRAAAHLKVSRYGSNEIFFVFAFQTFGVCTALPSSWAPCLIPIVSCLFNAEPFQSNLCCLPGENVHLFAFVIVLT